MSAPAPGSTPMITPTTLPRHIGNWYRLVSAHCPLRMEPKRRCGTGGCGGRVSARITSASAKTPTSAGTASMPPSRSVTPKTKRGVPAGFSKPTQDTSRPISIDAMAFTGEERATRVAHISPSSASQKYSKVEKDSAISASSGAISTRDRVPTMPPMALNQSPAPSATSGWPLRVIA